ncbi:MAG: riboflavin biosynthesis protein RibF [Muribaculaceae bacterium]|nr:riboflavin biosynthesis protein RibF [Muribaculaceae bacterium]
MKLITKSDSSARRIAAVGMYDGVHPGHRFLIDYLNVEARARGLRSAAVTFSRHPLSLVRPLEAPPLLSTLEDRVDMLGEAGASDVILLSFNDKLRRLQAEEFLRLLHNNFAIDALVLGFNNKFGHDGPDGLERYRQIGGKVGIEVIPAPEYRGKSGHVSSSNIRHLLMEGKPREAAEILGRPYRLRGRVVNGNHLGRTLGFATANVRPLEPSALIPKPGAYAAIVITPDGERRNAMVNIGYRPTLSDDEAQSELTIEAHILDYNGYLYDEDITVEFIEYMRPERRFPTPEKLRAQLAADAKSVRKILG